MRKNPVPAHSGVDPEGRQPLRDLLHAVPRAVGGKGNGLVAAKFVAPTDLSNTELQKGRTDGYWQSYLSVGGAVMPSYGESLSPEERWDVVNYLRTLAAK